MRRPDRRALGWTLLAATLVLGVFDQASATRSLNREHESIRAEWRATGDAVRLLESRLPAGAMVFELPVTTYQSESGRERMLPNDSLKPYIVSRTLHWSFPALANPIVRWQLAVGRLPAPMMIEALVRQQFAAILIDRYAYGDGGHSLLAQLAGNSRGDALIVRTDRYLAVDLGRVPRPDIAADRLPRLGASEPATAGLPRCAGTTSAHIDAIVQTPSGELSIDGWAIDEPRRALAGDVDVVVDDAVLPAFYGTERADVERYIGVPEMRSAGFTIRMRPTRAALRVSLRILSADRSCYYAGPEKLLAQSSGAAPGPLRTARRQTP